ncbi:MAG: hypothetical protein IJT66_03260 [Clostridia bacterium]|nr:hypothetical protein [Clostridia bacterium]
MKKKAILIVAICVAALAAVTALTVLTVHLFGKSAGKTPGSPETSTPSTGNMLITVENVTAQVGKNVRIPLTVSGNPGFMGAVLELTYDSDVLQYVGLEQSGIFTDCDASDEQGKLTLVDLENKDVTENGTLVYVNFKVKAGSSGTSAINLNIAKTGICNYEEQPLDCQAKSGTVTIQP